MKLALKLVSILILGVTIIIMVGGYLAVRRERELFMTDMTKDANLFGRSIKTIIADVWRTSGESRAIELIADLNQTPNGMHMRWVRFDADRMSPFAPLVPRDQLSPVLEGRDLSLVGRNQQGAEILLTYIPMEVDHSQPGALEISESLSAMSDYIHTTVVRTLAITGAMILLSGILVTVLGYRVVGQKVHRLARRARAIGNGDLKSRVYLKGRDELTELAGSMNLMCDQLLESQEKVRTETAARISALLQLRHEDRLRTVGRLASGLAHELGTPLNVVSGHAGLIAASALSQKESVESAQIIKSQAERMTTLIRQLLDFSRKSKVDREALDINDLARQTLNLILPLSQKKNVTIQFLSGNDPVQARVNSSQIQQVLMNLVTNSLQAVEPGGLVEILIERCDRSDPENSTVIRPYVRIDIKDNGGGIPEEDVPHIFEPFFTTKEVGEGTGLGLSIAYGIMREHDGWIEVTSEIGRGSCFSIYLQEEVAE